LDTANGIRAEALFDSTTTRKGRGSGSAGGKKTQKKMGESWTPDLLTGNYGRTHGLGQARRDPDSTRVRAKTELQNCERESHIWGRLRKQEKAKPQRRVGFSQNEHGWGRLQERKKGTGGKNLPV